LIHADQANVSKADIKVKLAKMLKAKEDAIVVFGLKTKFGGGKSTGFALVYDNADAKKKYDAKKRLEGVSDLRRIYRVSAVLTCFLNINRTYLLGENHSLRPQPKKAKEGYQTQETKTQRYR
jgi:small subunit ribosomal protein S24e